MTDPEMPALSSQPAPTRTTEVFTRAAAAEKSRGPACHSADRCVSAQKAAFKDQSTPAHILPCAPLPTWFSLTSACMSSPSAASSSCSAAPSAWEDDSWLSAPDSWSCRASTSSLSAAMRSSACSSRPSAAASCLQVQAMFARQMNRMPVSVLGCARLCAGPG